MGLISASLGVRCDQCHVPNAFEKDDKPPKQTARRMIRMVLDVNQGTFDGETEVTCYSCHRGQMRPVAVPPVGQETPQPMGRGAAGDGLPTFDQIVEKYLEAVGRASAFETLKTRVMKGTMVDVRGNKSPVEVSQAAPGRMVTMTTLPNGVSYEGYNGTVGWAKTPSGQKELRGAELAQVRREADLARPLKIREECLSPRVVGKTNIGGKEAYVVSARADSQRVQLFFDVQTGLLLRRRTLTNTVLGAFPDQTDFDDYREVDGVKLPFVTRRSTPDSAHDTTTTFAEIAHNVPVDEARFEPPAVQK